MRQDFSEKLGLKENIYEKDYDRHVAYITFNNPDKMNAYDSGTITELHRTWEDFKADGDLWVAIVSGKGKAFGTGHDISILSLDREFNFHDLAEIEPPSIHYGTIECFKPIIAAVHGHAVGGHCSFAMGCDLVVAAEGTKFGYPQPRYGFSSMGGHQWLPKMTFKKIAMEIMIT